MSIFLEVTLSVIVTKPFKRKVIKLTNYDYESHKKLILMFLEYRVIQKTMSIFLEVTILVIVTKPFKRKVIKLTNYDYERHKN